MTRTDRTVPGLNAPLRLLGALALAFVLFNSTQAKSQSASYSTEGASALSRAQDWNGLLRYSAAWTKTAPNDPLAWGFLGNAYGGLHRWAESADAARHALELKPDWAEAWHALGAANIMLGKYADAVQEITRAIQLKTTNPIYYNNLAAAYSNLSYHLQDRSAALKALDDERTHAGRYMNYEQWYNLGNGYLQLKAYEQALPAYQQVIKLNLRFGAAWNNLGSAEQYLGRYNDALRAYKQAASLGNSLGLSNYRRLQNDIAEAQRQAQPAKNCPLSLFAADCGECFPGELGGPAACIPFQKSCYISKFPGCPVPDY